MTILCIIFRDEDYDDSLTIKPPQHHGSSKSGKHKHKHKEDRKRDRSRESKSSKSGNITMKIEIKKTILYIMKKWIYNHDLSKISHTISITMFKFLAPPGELIELLCHRGVGRGRREKSHFLQ